jgi:hypothetical protein
MAFVEKPTDIAVIVLMGGIAILLLNPDLLLNILLYPGKKLYQGVYNEFSTQTKSKGTRAPPLPQQKTVTVDGQSYVAQLSPEGQKDNERGIWSVPWLPGASYRL